MAVRTSPAILLGVPTRRPPGLRLLAKGHLSKFVYFRFCLQEIRRFCLQEIKLLQVPAARSPSPPRMLRPRHSGRPTSVSTVRRIRGPGFPQSGRRRPYHGHYGPDLPMVLERDERHLPDFAGLRQLTISPGSGPRCSSSIASRIARQIAAPSISPASSRSSARSAARIGASWSCWSISSLAAR